MKNINKKSVLLLASAGLLGFALGCSKDDKKSVENRVDYPEVQHTWAAPCTSSKLLGASERSMYQFKGSDLIEAKEYYSDASCQSPTIVEKYSGNFDYKGDSPTVPGTKEIQYTLANASVTPLNQAGVDFLSHNLTGGLCGNTAWAVNQPVDLTNQSGGTACPLKDVPASGWLLTKVDGSTFFTSEPTRDANTKPSSIDTTKPYTQIQRNL
jgi:hypothetical protein